MARKSSSKQTQKPAQATPAQPAAQAPAPVAAQPKPATVALRGGAAVAQVRLAPGATYRTKAAHNVAWWTAIGNAVQAGNGTAKVTDLLAQAPAGPGVPAHFVGYCLRRGYLQAA